MKRIYYILTFITMYFISILPASAVGLAKTSYASITDVDRINNYHAPLTFGSICAIILFIIFIIIFLSVIIRYRSNKRLIKWSISLPISLLLFLLVQVRVIHTGYIMFLLYALSFLSILLLEKVFFLMMKSLLKSYKLLHPIILTTYFFIMDAFIVFILLFNSIGMIYKVISIIELGIIIYLSIFNYKKYNEYYIKKAGIE